MAVETAEPTVVSPATAPPAAKTNVGAKYREALAKVQTVDAPPDTKTEPTQTPPPVKPPAPPSKPPDEGTPPPKSSALDVALAGKEPAKPEPPPEDEISKTLSELKSVSKPTADHWDKARKAIEHQTELINRTKSELEKAKGELGKVDPNLTATLDARSKELESTKAEVAKLREAITALNVEYDPQFQEKFVAGREKMVDRAIKRVKDFGGDVEKFTEAIMLSGKRQTEALDEALTGLSDRDRNRVFSILDDIQKLDDEREELRKDPHQTFEKFSASRREEQERIAEDNARLRKSEFEKTVKFVRDKSPLLQHVDPNVTENGQEWNEGIKNDIARAETLFGPDSVFSDVVEAAVKGSRYDFVEKTLLETRKELAEANKRLAEYEASSPDFRGTGKAPKASDTRSYAQKYKDVLAEIQSGEDEE
jgi:hypothetical protein